MGLNDEEFMAECKEHAMPFEEWWQKEAAGKAYTPEDKALAHRAWHAGYRASIWSFILAPFGGKDV